MKLNLIFLIFYAFLMCLEQVKAQSSELSAADIEKFNKLVAWQQKVEARCKRVKKHAHTFQGQRAKWYKRFCLDNNPKKMPTKDDYDYS